MRLVVYLDESGTHEQAQVLSVAGYVAFASQWIEFKREWRDCLEKYGLDSFHMTDFENRKKQFEGWKNERRIGLMKKLITLIHRRLAYGVCVSVRLDDFGKLLPTKKAKDQKVGAYTICVIDCMKKTEQWSRARNLDASIDYVIETGSRLGRVVPKIWHSYSEGERRSLLMGSLTFGSKQDKEFQSSFEAADILAYEGQKFFSAPVGKRLRKSFKRLLRPGDFGHCLEFKDLKYLFDKFCPPEMRSSYLAQFEEENI